jgi:hypothetical protein
MTIPNGHQVLNLPPQNQNLSQDPSQSQTQQTLNTQNPDGGQSGNQQNQDPNAAIFNMLNEMRGEIGQLRQQNQMLQFQTQQQSNRGGFPQQVQQQQVPEVQVPDKDAFWENPGQATKNVVEQLMQRSIQPIQQGLNFFMSQQQYQSAKAHMKNLNQFQSLPLIEDIFDNIVNSALQSGNALSDGLLITSYHTAVGLGAQQGRFNNQQQGYNNGQYNGQQQFQQPQQQNSQFVVGQNTQGYPGVQNQQAGYQQNAGNNQQQNNQNRVVTPPYLAPNNGGNQGNGVQVRLRDLTENEEIVRRRTGQSKAEFLFYGDEIGVDVFQAADQAGFENYKKSGAR